MRKTVIFLLILSLMAVLVGCKKKKVTITTTTEASKYVVTWKNYDGSVLETDTNVIEGSTPQYNGATPTKANDAGKVFAFYKWDKTLSEVTSDITYTATFKVLYTRNGDVIEYGMYPQTKVEDATLRDQLEIMGGTHPTDADSGTWTSYEYYIYNSNEVDFMWYKDVTYNGEKYRGVYYDQYRPKDLSLESDNDDLLSSQYANDCYLTYEYAYWFKFEPIKWKILFEDDYNEIVLLKCDSIIDSREFYTSTSEEVRVINDVSVYPNNWEYSSIRKWLNEDFYNTAFNQLEQDIMLSTTVKNKYTANGDSSNAYAVCQNDTTDKIFLPSYADVKNTIFFSNIEARKMTITSYAKTQGALASDEFAYWMTRSPHTGDPRWLSGVSPAGESSSIVNFYDTNFGIVPMLRMKLA